MLYPFQIIHVQFMLLGGMKEVGGSVACLKKNNNLFAAEAVFGKLLIMAGAAVNVISFGKETQRSYWSFTVATGETFIVPRVSFVLHTLCACRR